MTMARMAAGLVASCLIVCSSTATLRAAPPPTVAEFLSRIDIFVLPSRTEVLSNSLPEAMACECCVVASRVAAIRSWLVTK